jgi:methylated-DNA-[protein]-cysteine S-methyltransferase
MEVMSGSCRLGLWFVHVRWNGNTVHQVRFATTGIPGDVPVSIRQFCAGRPADLSRFETVAINEGTVYGRIYEAVRTIPYGKTATYGEIAAIAGTSPRVVGQAMARNPTPLIVPCHRVVAAKGIGGFTPPIEIKEELLAMEKKGLWKERKKAKSE